MKSAVFGGSTIHCGPHWYPRSTISFSRRVVWTHSQHPNYEISESCSESLSKSGGITKTVQAGPED